MIDRNDVGHPQNHPCARCHAASGEKCRSRTGKILIGPDKTHRSRHDLAAKARAHSRLLAPGLASIVAGVDK